MADKLAILALADKIMGDTSKQSDPNVLDALARLRRTIVRSVSKLVETAEQQERETCAVIAELMQLDMPSNIAAAIRATR